MPFDLGRPFGAPAEPEFQSSVLRAVLGLLDRNDGPVILEDFPDDAPGQGREDSMEGMVCPVPLRKPASAAQATELDHTLEELTQLAPWHQLFCETHERSTVGVSGMTAKDAAALLHEIKMTGHPSEPNEELWGGLLRFAGEDLRNYYLEAASMRPGGTALPEQMANWFWGETSAGALLLALHPLCLKSDNESLRSVAASQLIPRAQHHRLEPNT